MTRRASLLCLLLLMTTACGERQPPAPAVGAPARYDRDGRWTGTPPAPAKRPNIVLIVIDTLRADALAPEREDGGDMPYLSRLARENVAFSQASSTSSWTVPALASTLTGLLPSHHGMRDGDSAPGHTNHLITLAEILQRTGGYQTGAFFGGLWPQLSSALAQGFEEKHDDFRLQRIEERLGRWSERRRPDQPFFLMLHSYEAHDPYGEANHPAHERVDVTDEVIEELLALGDQPPPAELARLSVLSAAHRTALRTHPALRGHERALTRYLWSGLREAPDPTLANELKDAYRSGTRWVDGLLERSFKALKAHGLLEDTLWIVTSDHGEAFGEHGMLLHGRQLYDELLRIPLVMGGRAPFDRPLESPASVSLADLLPTLLDLAALPTPADLDGRSFLPGLREGSAGQPVCAEVSRTALHTANLSVAEVCSVRDGAWKYIGTLDRTSGTLTEEAYDLRSDPGEQRNLASADGFVRDLPFDAAFCHAVESARDRLWAQALQVDWNARQGYGAGSLAVRMERPTPDCDGPTR